MSNKQEPKKLDDLSIEEKTKFFEDHFSPLIRYGYNTALLDFLSYWNEQKVTHDFHVQISNKLFEMQESKKQVDWDKLKVELTPHSVEQPKQDDLVGAFNKLDDGKNFAGWTQFEIWEHGVLWADRNPRTMKEPEQPSEGQRELWNTALMLIQAKTDFRVSSDGKLKGLGNQLLEQFTIYRKGQAPSVDGELLEALKDLRKAIFFDVPDDVIFKKIDNIIARREGSAPQEPKQHHTEQLLKQETEHTQWLEDELWEIASLVGCDEELDENSEADEVIIAIRSKLKEDAEQELHTKQPSEGQQEFQVMMDGPNWITVNEATYNARKIEGRRVRIISRRGSEGEGA